MGGHHQLVLVSIVMLWERQVVNDGIIFLEKNLYAPMFLVANSLKSVELFRGMSLPLMV